MSARKVAKPKARARRGSGSIKRESDGLYSLRYYENGKQHRAPIRFQDEEAAELWNAERKLKSARGEWKDPRRSSELLRVFAERELASRTYTPLARDRAEWQWSRYIDPAFGDWPLNKISLEDVEEWRSGLLADGVGKGSVRLAYNTFKSLMNSAVEREKITRNPCRIKGANKTKAQKRAHVSYDECIAITAQLPEHLRPLATVAWWSAARRGEVLGMQWRDINLNTGDFHIRHQVVQVGSTLHETAPKWGSDRIITLPEPGLEVLRELRSKVQRDATDQRVFTNRAGTALTPHALGQAWRRARAKAQLQHVAFHDLRRSSATAMLASGMSIYDIMLWLGHQEITTTQLYLLDDTKARPARAAAFAAHVTLNSKTA